MFPVYIAFKDIAVLVKRSCDHRYKINEERAIPMSGKLWLRRASIDISCTDIAVLGRKSCDLLRRL